MNQINLLKGFAILGVIFVHTVPSDLVTRWQTAFYFNQQVPIFIILSGITAMLSCEKRNLFKDKEISLIDYKKYIIRRIKGIFPNIAIFFIASTIGWILLDIILKLKKGYGFGIYSIIFRPPLDGPGGYYIAILLQIILLTPILVYLFNRNSILSLIAMIIINLLFEVFIAKLNIFNGTYLYKSCILRYFSALGLGMYISKDLRIKSKRNLFIIVLMPLSCIYIYMNINYNYTFLGVVEYSWHFQNMFATFYPAFFILLIINYFNRSNKFTQKLEFLGKNSFNIFLFQILYFSLGLSLMDTILFKIVRIENEFLVYILCFYIDLKICIKGAQILDNMCKKTIKNKINNIS